MVALNVTHYEIRKNANTMEVETAGGRRHMVAGNTATEVVFTVLVSDPDEAMKLGEILNECRNRGVMPLLEPFVPTSTQPSPRVFRNITPKPPTASDYRINPYDRTVNKTDLEPDTRDIPINTTGEF